MGSRGKQKMITDALRAAQKRETILAPEISFPGGGFSETREMRDAQFRREVEARRDAARMIEQSKALKARMEERYEEGRAFGFKQAAMPMFKTCIAAACVALHDELGMDDGTIYQAASAIGQQIIYCLNNQELVDETLEKTGIRIDMNDTLEPIQQI